MKKRIIIGVLLVLLVIVILFGALIVKDIYETRYKIQTIDIFKNEETGHSVVFQKIGSEWPFAPARVRLILQDEHEMQISVISDQIANDGKGISNCVSVKWDYRKVTIILSGEEQEDKTYTIAY